LAISWLFGGGLPQALRTEIENRKVVPAQGFEPWTIGLKDRRSNQAELRRLNMIFSVLGFDRRSAAD
jgi:hypothetical protein